jgi:transcription elongation GreA/GreB family factor
MGVPRKIQGYLAKGDFEALEDEWLRLVAEDPTDLDTYVSVARALAGTDEAERARFLLEMLDEELGDREQWPARLKLLRRAGHLLRDPEQEEEFHPQILDTLEKIYGDRPSFGDLVAAVGLHRAPGDIPKTWDKVERFESLIVFDVGSVVEMENRGVGRVMEVNQELESFKVDFEGFRGLTVGFRAAAKLLRPLPGDHVLRRKLERPEELAELAEDDPPELLHQVLASYDRPLKAGEVRQVLSGVVEEERWSSWWTAARKHPQVVAKGSGGRQTYHWAESDADALETLWKAFTKAEPRRRIELLRRDGSRDRDLQKRMAENLAATADEVWQDDPGLAFEIWFALERARGAPEGVPWAPEALLDSVPSQELFAGIADRLLRERAYTMYRERKDDWPEVFQVRMAREEDPRALDLLAEGLRRQEPDRFGRVVDDLMAQPQRAPAAFTWLAERAAVDEELRERNPLRLLIQILQALGQDELKPYRTRLSPLADSGGTLPRLLSHLTEDQAEQAEQAIQRAAAFEPYQRDQLVEALRLRFQGLTQDVVKEPLYATPGSIEAKREEFQVLVTKELPANRKAIEEARALGDLRENFEYKAARQRHEYLSARAAQLEGELARVQPIAEDIDPSQVRVGTEVELTTDGGTRTVTLLGPWESDPENDVISYLSDLGQALLGKQPGETVTVGTTSYTVGGITSRR